MLERQQREKARERKAAKLQEEEAAIKAYKERRRAEKRLKLEQQQQEQQRQGRQQELEVRARNQAPSGVVKGVTQRSRRCCQRALRHVSLPTSRKAMDGVLRFLVVSACSPSHVALATMKNAHLCESFAGAGRARHANEIARSDAEAARGAAAGGGESGVGFP